MLSSGKVLNMSRTTNENDKQCAVSKFTNNEINETVISLSTDINEIKSNVQLLEQEVEDQRETTLKSLSKVR
jgi:hypothetical protein